MGSFSSSNLLRSELVAHRADFFLLFSRRARFGWRGVQKTIERNKTFQFLLAQNVFTIQASHLLVFELLAKSFITRPHFLFARRLCNALLIQVVLPVGLHVLFNKDQVVLLARQRYSLVTGEDF